NEIAAAVGQQMIAHPVTPADARPVALFGIEQAELVQRAPRAAPAAIAKRAAYERVGVTEAIEIDVVVRVAIRIGLEPSHAREADLSGVGEVLREVALHDMAVLDVADRIARGDDDATGAPGKFVAPGI